MTGIVEAGGGNGCSPCRMILSNSLTRAAERHDSRQPRRSWKEKEEKAELLIVWFLRRNMSDILLSMKLSCKSFSAPVVHTDKASCTKNSLQLDRDGADGNREQRKEAK